MTRAKTVKQTDTQKVVIVTGPSGAGRSTTISALEDMGYEVIDNIPLVMIPRLVSGPPLEKPLALGLDTRTRDFSPERVLGLVERLSGEGDLAVELLYLDCQPDILLRRFSETRRRHPMAPKSSPEVGIADERTLLRSLRARADILIDTSRLTPHDLREELRNRLYLQSGGDLAVTIQSFSFKRGLPRGLDMVFDVRFLRNPHWDPDLRDKTGLDADVGQYVSQDALLPEFLDRLTSMALFLLPAFAKEGKSYLSIGIGCTGGQHRSVFVTEKLAKLLAEEGWQVSTRHRELSRRAETGAASDGSG